MEDRPDPEGGARGGPRGEPSRPRPSGTRRCPRCGALNGADFDQCIRCAAPLTARAVPARAPQPAARAGVDRFWATQIILGLTALTFAGQIMVAFARTKSIGLALGTGGNEVDLMRFGAMSIATDIVAREPWLLLSCAFVHFGILHFGMNMVGFWSLARSAEPAVGSARLLIAYVAAGLAGSVATIVLSASEGSGILGAIQRVVLAQRGLSVIPLTAGASGAIFGVMGLMLGFMLRRRDSRWKSFATEAVLFAVLFGFAANAVPGSKIAVNNAAHLGGLACGIVFGLIYAGRGRKAPAWLMNAAAALCLLACLASLLLAQLSPRWRDLDRSLQASHVRVLNDTMIAPPRPTV